MVYSIKYIQYIVYTIYYILCTNAEILKKWKQSAGFLCRNWYESYVHLNFKYFASYVIAPSWADGKSECKSTLWVMLTYTPHA